MSTHRPRLTAGAYAASLRDMAPSITPDLKAALAFGPLSLADLAAKAGQAIREREEAEAKCRAG